MRKTFTSLVAAAIALSTAMPAFAATIRVGGAVMLPTNTIVENASKASTLKTLVTAVKAANLAETLSGEGPFTVFAPTDSAFRAVRAKIDRMMDMENKADLAATLKFHVVAGKYLSADLKNGMTLTTVQGEKLTIKKLGRSIWVNGARIQTRDVIAKNGVVHVISKVLMPTMKPTTSSSSSRSSSVMSSSSSSMMSSSSSSAMSSSSMSSSSVMSSSSSSMAPVPTAWAVSAEGTWQDKEGKWLKIDASMVKYKNTAGTWSPLANWQWHAEDGNWYKFEADWTLVMSKDGVKWTKVENMSWPGKMGYWYKLGADGKVWWMSDGTWKKAQGGTWQDVNGTWFMVVEGKLMSSANGTLWSEVPNWQWKGIDGGWYKFDKEWKLWSTANGTVWAEVPSMTWKNKDGSTLMLDSNGVVWVKA
jgi:uncharacterized surface protein with fasciclin (FAS1) repeats